MLWWIFRLVELFECKNEKKNWKEFSALTLLFSGTSVTEAVGVLRNYTSLWGKWTFSVIVTFKSEKIKSQMDKNLIH